MPKKKLPRRYLLEIFPPYQPMRVKYKDIFSLNAFYEFFREWLNEHGWKDEEDDLDHWESYYGERITAGNMKEIWALWRVKKKAEGAPLTYYLDIDWHCVGITNIEIVKEGKKFNVNKGEVELIFRAYIYENYKEDLDKNKLLKPFKELFSRRVYDEAVKLRRKELYQEVYVLQNWIKQWFKMKRYLPYEEVQGFYRSQAWPSHVKEG